MSKKIKFDIAVDDNTSSVFSKLDNNLSNISSKTSSLTSSMGTLAGAVGVGAVVTSFVSLTKNAFDTGDALAKTSDKLGIASDSLASLHHVAELTGVGTNKLNTSLEKMNIRISEASIGMGTAKKSFDELGLSTQELLLMSPDEAFIKINESLKEIPNQTERARHAYNIFGRSGVDILNIANEGKESIKAMMTEAENLGMTVSRMDLAKFEMANDSLYKLQGLVKGVATKVAIELAPIITGVTDYLIEATTESKNFKNIGMNAMEGIAQGVSLVADGLQGLHIIYKSLEVSLRFWELATITTLSTIATSVDKFKVSFNEDINSTLSKIQVFLDKASVIPIFGKNYKYVSELIDGFKATNARNEVSLLLEDYQKLSKKGFNEATKELNKLTKTEWTSEKITKIFDDIKIKAEASSKSIAKNRNKLIVRESEEENNEKTDPLKIKKNLLLEDKKRLSAARSLINSFSTQKERLQNQKDKLIELYNLRDQKGNPFISDEEFNQTLKRIDSKMNESSDSWKKDILSFRDIGKDSLKEVSEGFKDMAIDGEVSLSKLGKMFLKSFQTKAISSTVDAGFTGISNLFGGFFADGGELPANKFAVAGEKGAEIIAPASYPRRIYSNQQSKDLFSRGSSASQAQTIVNQTISLTPSAETTFAIEFPKYLPMIKKVAIEAILEAKQRGVIA